MEAPIQPDADTDAGISMNAGSDDVTQEGAGRVLTPRHPSSPPMPAQRQEAQQAQPAQQQEGEQLLQPTDEAPLHLNGKGEPPRKKKGLCSELTSEGSCWSKLVDDAPPSCVIA